MRAIVEVRSQHSRGSSSGKFGGPDTYVSVQIVPEGVKPLACLNYSVAAKRGIKIEYCGEGYSRNSGPHSALGKALAAAKIRAAKLNSSSGEFVYAVLSAQKIAKQKGI